MKRIQFIGIVLFLLGMFIQPCVAQKKGQTNQQLAIEYVSKLSDDQVRAQLPGFRQEKEKCYHLYQKSLHGSGNLIGVDQALYKGSYEYNSYIVAEMEKRMRVIDAKKAKEDAAQKAKEQKQQGTNQEGDDLDRQSQKEFNEAVERNKEQLNGKYMEGHKTIDASQDAIKNNNLASDGLLSQAYDPKAKPVSQGMLDKPLGGTTAQQGKPSIARKFQKPTQSKQQEEANEDSNKKKRSKEELLKRQQELLKMLDE